MTERSPFIKMRTPKDLKHSKSSNYCSEFTGRGPDAVLTVLDDWLALMKLGNFL